MTDQQLIKKLRWGWRFVEGQDISNRDLEQAANRIAEVVRERDELGRKLNTARYGQPDFAWSIHEEAMADLRAKLTKVVEALMQLQLIVGDILGAHMQDNESRDEALALIKNTLAKLEGDNV